MDIDRVIWYVGLSRIRGIGCIIGKRLIEIFSEAQKIFSAPFDELENTCGSDIAKRIKEFTGWREVERELKEAKSKGFLITCYGDGKYPRLLEHIPDPPFYLYYKGEITPDALCVSIVGTRRPSSYGVDVARRFAQLLCSAGVCVISGMARGIDSIAHRGALEVGGVTWAVLGSGPDVIYPQESVELYMKIAERGAVISEFPLGTPPHSQNFPRRNRIISGISKGVVVVEAGEKSGALITAYLAMEQGREVFAIPGHITSERSKGTHRLIKEGAHLTETPEDILSEIIPELGLKKPAQVGFVSPSAQMSFDETKVLDSLDTEYPIHVDELIRKTEMEPEKVLSILLMLEVKGLVKEEGMGFYRKLS